MKLFFTACLALLVIGTISTSIALPREDSPQHRRPIPERPIGWQNYYDDYFNFPPYRPPPRPYYLSDHRINPVNPPPRPSYPPYYPPYYPPILPIRPIHPNFPIEPVKPINYSTKTRWPEVVGLSGQRAKRIILSQRPNLNVIILREGSATTKDLRRDRVWVFVDRHHIVRRTPTVGWSIYHDLSSN